MNRTKVLVISPFVDSKIRYYLKLTQPDAEVILATEPTKILTLLNEQDFTCLCLDETVFSGDLREEFAWVREINFKVPLWVICSAVNTEKIKQFIKAAAIDCVVLNKLTPDYLNLMLRTSHKILHEQKLAEQAEQALQCSEFLGLLMQKVTQLVLEERPSKQILDFVCKQLVKFMKLRMAWIGIKEPDGTLSINAVNFETAVHLKDIDEIKWDPQNFGPISQAFKTGESQIIDIELVNSFDMDIFLGNSHLLSQGVRMIAVFPFKLNDGTIGILNLYSSIRNFFNKRLIEQLENFSAQVSVAMGLTSIRHQVAIFTTALESAANAMVITDQEGKVWWANSAFTELTGYSWFELLGQNLRLLKSGLQGPKFYQKLWQQISAGEVWKGELVNRRKDGSLYDEEMTITPVRDEHGEISNFIGIKEDITQRKRDISERKASEQRLLEANIMISQAERLASLGTMAAGIAHEINQPLNSLKVMADGMLYWYKKGKPAAYDKVMGNIQNISYQADRIDRIIKHMRAFVRSGQPSKLTNCNLKTIVEGALDMVGSQLVSHGVLVQKDLTETWVLGEDTRLEEVVINLLINAMQSLDQMNQGEKQIICRSWVETRVILEISDNGIGIPEEIKSSIFEPFFTTKPVGEGTGLGLSIVHTILSIYDGRIQALTNEYGGATFRIDFPLAENSIKGAGK